MKQMETYKRTLFLIVTFLIIAIIVTLFFIRLRMANAYSEKGCNDFYCGYLTPTPTVNPCQFWKEDKWEEDCITPTVTPTVTPTPTATPSGTPTPTSTPSSGGTNTGSGGPGVVPVGDYSTTEVPGAPTCNIPFSAPVLTSITAGESGQLTLNWLESASVDKFSITYGFVGQSLSMGVDNIPSSSRSFTIGDLPSGAYINAQVQGWQNGCEESSNVLDPIVR